MPLWYSYNDTFLCACHIGLCPYIHKTLYFGLPAYCLTTGSDVDSALICAGMRYYSVY